jgi:hypothetical protein
MDQTEDFFGDMLTIIPKRPPAAAPSVQAINPKRHHRAVDAVIVLY